MDGAENTTSSPEKEPRPPKLTDIGRIGAELNRLGAKYVVVGGFAIIQAGYPRFTRDIDLLIDTSPANEALVFQALRILPDKAVDQLEPGDVARFTVVRVADEIVVDLMASGCGVRFSDAIQDAVFQQIDGVSIPFASPKTLWKMKQTVREKDIPDRIFLKNLLSLTEGKMERPESSLLAAVRKFFRR